MHLFLFLARCSPWLFGLSVVAGIISGVASAALMALLNTHLASLGNAGSAFFRDFLALTALALGSQLATRLGLLRLATRAVRRWRLGLCAQLLAAPLRSIEEHGAAGLMATLTNDIAEVTEALTRFPVQCVNGVVIVACFGYLFWLSWPMALGFVVTMVAGVAVYEAIVRRARRHMVRLRDTWDHLIGHFTALVEGNKELKLNRVRRDAFAATELQPAADAMMQASWQFNRTFAIAETSGQLFFYLLVLSIPVFAMQLHGNQAAIVTGFVVMLLYMSGRIAEFVGAMPVFHRADVARKKIASLGMTLGAEAVPAPAGAQVPGVAGAIEMQQLLYRYGAQGDDPGFQLGPLDLCFVPGEITFVIGGNGSGKSSFARVLTGLYPASAGRLLFNGEVVDAAGLDLYRQQFSVVFSDFHLFRNLYDAMPDERREKALHFLATLQLQDKVILAGAAFSTVALSQGQRKRLALLTCFLEDRPVYVFDEWASDQDPQFKKVFYYQILPELAQRGKTVIVISHDDHYFDVAQRLVRFEDGRVVDDQRPAPALRHAG